MPNEISLFFVVSSMVKKSIYANTDIKPNNALLMRQINQSSALFVLRKLVSTRSYSQPGARSQHEVGWQEKYLFSCQVGWQKKEKRFIS